MPCPWRGHVPSSGIGKKFFQPILLVWPRHGQSNGVLALHPNKGVMIRPPRSASAGSSGTAVVARKLTLLFLSSVTHPSGDFLDAPGALTCERGCHTHRSEQRLLLACSHLEFPCPCRYLLAGWQCGL